MHIKIKREYNINAKLESVFNLFVDPKVISQCVPNLEEIKIEDNGFKGKIKPPFTFIKGKFNIETFISQVKDKDFINIDIKGRSIGSSFIIKIILSFTNNTLILADIDAEVTGLLKAIPSSLINKVIEDTETHMINCLKSKLV